MGRTMTTSVGSVCLGSLIVAFLQAVRAMLRSSKNGRSFLTLIALCLLGCIERLIRYFNKYAYAQCAIYGTSFVTSAKATWNLFMNRGILAIINDDLTGMAIGCGAMIGGIVSAGTGFLIGYAFYGQSEDEEVYPTVPVALAIYGFFIGLVFCASVDGDCFIGYCAVCLLCGGSGYNEPKSSRRLSEFSECKAGMGGCVSTIWRRQW